MKKIFSLLSAMLIVVGVFAQTTETIAVTLADGQHDGAQIVWSEVNSNITITQMKGTSTTAVNANYIAGPRMYKGHILSFECADNYTITSIKLVCSGKYIGSNIQVGNTIVEEVVQNNADLFVGNFTTESGGTHEITTTNAEGESLILLQNALADDEAYTQLRPTSIEITYIKKATTEPSITCGDVIFKATEPTTQEIQVVGENLTEAIVASMKDGSSFAVAGTLTAQGGTLTITVTATAEGEYSDVLLLTSGSLVKEVNVKATVLVLDGDGTQENPYSVADVHKLQNPGTQAWVEGHIIGSMINNKLSVDSVVASNLVLATNVADTLFVPVALPKSAVRDALNLVDNSSLLGKKVAIQGTLEAYFSMPGLKSPKAYVIFESTDVKNVVAPEQKAQKIMRNGQLYIISDGVMYNMLGQAVK